MGKEKTKEIYVVGTKKFFGSVIRKEGSIFDLEGMYKAWKEWFSDHNYFLNEKAQSGKDLPSHEREEKIEWVAERKITSYVKFHIILFLWVRRMSNVIAEVDGKKQKVQKGDLFIGFKGFMEKDYKKKWKNEFLRQMYDRFVIKNKLIDHEGKIWAETNDFIDLTKKFVGMMPLKREGRMERASRKPL